MDIFGYNLPVMGNDTDLDLIDPDKLYQSNDEVNHSDYLFEESTSNDSGYHGELIDYQTKTQNCQSESLFGRYEQISLSSNFQQGVPSNSYNVQNDLPFDGNFQTSNYDKFRSLKLPGQAELQLPKNEYPATCSYSDFDNISTFPRYSGSATPINSSNEAAGDNRQTFFNPIQPMNNFDGNHLHGGLLHSERQRGHLVLPENSEKPRKQRSRNKLPYAEYNCLSEDQKAERKKKLALETSQRYAKKQKDRVRQLQMDEQRLPISIQDNSERISNMNRMSEILEKATDRLRCKQFNNLVLD